jgi:hypothetical protein
VQDLFEIAQQEFFDAIPRFDPGYGVPFGNYAAISAEFAFKRHIKRAVKTVPIDQPVRQGSTVAYGDITDQQEWISGCLDDERLGAMEAALARLKPLEAQVLSSTESHT